MNHVRTLLSVALLCLLFPTFIYAATPEYGVRLGISLGSPVPIGNIPQGSTGAAVVGLVAGGTVNWDFGGPWSVVSELQYVHYGSTFSSPLSNQPYIDKVPVSAPDGTQVIYEVNTTFTGTTSGSFSNDYVQLPVLASYKASDKVRILAGTYLGWLFATHSHAKGVGTVGIRPEVVEKDMYFGEKLNGVDYGLQLGANYAISKYLAFDIRCTMGLTSIFDQQFKTVDQTVRNVYAHLSIVYSI